MFKLTALAALAFLPAVFGQGLAVTSPDANTTIRAGHPVTIQFDTWYGVNNEPAPTEAYFWITAANANGVKAFNIGPDGIGRIVAPADKAVTLDLSSSSIKYTPNYTDFLTDRALSAAQVRLLVSSGDIRDDTVVGSKGTIYVSRPLMVTGESPDGAGVNSSITETNAMPVTTDSAGAKIQHQTNADQHVTGTVNAKSAAPRTASGVTAAGLMLVLGTVSAVVVLA